MTPRGPRTAGILFAMAALIAVPLLVQGGSGTDDQAEAVAHQFAARLTAPAAKGPDEDAFGEQALFVGQGVAGLAALAWALRTAQRQ
jgi:hypothetical protein